ncbi:MAG: TetR/AcrR family transcriptional regulator [Leptolyngbya sp. SIO1E4]|nr:TetR/AcrR family transcriptional regulator [Leptolyngbya sp. SIO1E4]
MNITKKTGRPRGFEHDEALMAAVQVFWVKGYKGASIKDLTDAMGIKAPSLYATFGDKLNLYRQAIERYAANESCAPLVAFESEPDIYQAVRAFIEAVIDYATQHESGVRGCFLSSCVATSAGEVEGVDEFLRTAIQETDARIAKRFDRAKETGALPHDFPSLERARLLLDLRQGYVFRARAGLEGDAMKTDLDHRIRMVLG